MTYCNWLKKIINVLIEMLLFFAIAVTLYVFTSAFSGVKRLMLFFVILVLYISFIILFKKQLKIIIIKINNILEKIDSKKMLVIISITMIILKILYTFFWNYDATLEGDIGIYNQIANQIIATGSLRSDSISHLLGIGSHLALFKVFQIPLHIGVFIVYFIGTIINFLSFKEIVGKNKAFIIVMLYIVMPSSILLSFCPTHEVFLYTYISIAIFFLNMFIKSNNAAKKIISSSLIIIFSFLACFVNPSGYIILIIIGLIILLSKICLKKKIILVFVLLFSITSINVFTSFIETNDFNTTFNTYAILIHGSNPNSLGEQVDSYPVQEMDKYLKAHGLHTNEENVIYAEKMVLLEQYKYLITHPIVFGKLIAHKFYILWSGNHYSIEMAHNFKEINDIEFYILLCINTLIYLFVLTIGLIYSKKTDDGICISNYKLVILGCFAITMLSVVLNKYSLYVTLFIYLISFYKISIDE